MNESRMELMSFRSLRDREVCSLFFLVHRMYGTVCVSRTRDVPFEDRCVCGVRLYPSASRSVDVLSFPGSARRPAARSEEGENPIIRERKRPLSIYLTR